MAGSKEIGNMRGVPGKSAYEIAVEHGFEGTEDEWLLQLYHGPDAIYDWLAAHPEVTTTVQDGEITKAKLHEDLVRELTETDTSLKDKGKAADAYAVGEALSNLNDDMENVVHVKRQTLTPAEKKQVRENIGAVSIETGTTTTSAGTWEWTKYSNGLVECSIDFSGSVTAKNLQGSMYYSETYFWKLPFKLRKLKSLYGVVGTLGHICNPTRARINNDTPEIGFRLAFPTAKASNESDIMLTVKGWLA